MPQTPLTPIQARVLGTLMEKARTVPDSYPLSLNSLVIGCNQKTSRDPIMEVSDSQALEALDALKGASLVFESSGGRVTRYEHNAQRVWAVPEQAAVLLGVLLIRGPQTAAELRTNAERWYKFADAGSVEVFLQELEQRPEEKGGPLVTLLPRLPGAREQRWAHLLCGPEFLAQYALIATESRASSDSALDTHGLTARVTALENEIAVLRATVQSLCAELGLSQPGQGA